MTRAFWPILLLLAGCIGSMRQEYGAKHPEGELLATSCVVVRSFAPELRSAPGLHGPDSFIGYLDYGPGMSRGYVFLVLPVESKSYGSIGELLQSVDPRRRSFWLETKLISGDLSSNESFEAFVPPKQHSPSPNSTFVEREMLLIRGSFHTACRKRYLLAVHGNPFAIKTSIEWPKIRASYDLFKSNLQWPP